MAKIIYGVAGEGRGHSSRSKTIIDYLISQGHEVKIFTSNKAYNYLKDYFDDVYNVLGLSFVFDKGEIKVFDTIKKNIESASSKGWKSLSRIIKVIREFKPDFALTDFEPLVPIVSKWFGLPFYSINHQNYIAHTKLDYPCSWRTDYLNCLAIVNNMYMNAEKYFVTTFYFPEVKKRMKKRTILFGPILRNEVLKQKPKKGKHVLVYVTTNKASDILEILPKLDEKFVVYGFKNKKDYKNIKFKEASNEGFLKNLTNSKAVITNGGYTLMSEALYLKKPIYSIPIKNQFEQLINAYYLEKLGFGLYDLNPNKERLIQFFSGLKYFKRNISKNKDNFKGNEFIFNELDKIINKHSK
jgi:uncharacterized protein (TIGR00661 family)